MNARSSRSITAYCIASSVASHRGTDADIFKPRRPAPFRIYRDHTVIAFHWFLNNEEILLCIVRRSWPLNNYYCTMKRLDRRVINRTFESGVTRRKAGEFLWGWGGHAGRWTEQFCCKMLQTPFWKIFSYKGDESANDIKIFRKLYYKSILRARNFVP